jgi:8-oxo-dGTP pyrophosphatase MutT (NUDIX family)
MTLFVTASVCVLRDGALLTVRKRGTRRFMLPGGKLEPGESPIDCAVREAAEEIGLSLSADDLTELGEWTSPAANEPGALVRSTVFLAPPGQPEPHPLGEIEELRWQPWDERSDDLAPLLVEHVLAAVSAL